MDLQLLATRHIFLDIKNLKSVNIGDPIGSRTRNLYASAPFYQVRRRRWPPEHAAVIFDSVMQAAFSRFNQSNHNLVTEMRVIP